MQLKIFQRINVEHPTLLASWPGMGNVALIAIDYLRRELKAELIGEIDVSEFVTPNAVIVEEGLLKLPHIPKHNIYYRKQPDLIIVEGESQLREKASILVIEQIIKLIKEFKVAKIFTGAAFPLPIHYQDPSIVYGCATTRNLRDILFSEYQVKVLEKGEISGLNGLLLGYAREIGIPAACLLATIPIYGVNLPNPKASKSMVKIFERLLGVKVNTMALDIEVERMEKELAELEERIKEELGTPLLTPAEAEESSGGEAPLHVRQRIERLFREARQDKSRAYLLKRELDKWNLFDSYEDRFLDLFKEH